MKEAGEDIMALDPGLLEILACPDDKGPLRYFRDEDLLYNPRLGRTYPIQDGIPVLLISEAQALDDDERQRLDAKSGEETGPKTSEG
ncbi:MAG: Trm112 family protein [Acidimicrobiales bacterium]|nr:Trm112 family protein [Acidimicrobiales bacterium]